MARAVWRDPCRGIHREALAEMFGYDPHDKQFVSALMIAYKQRTPDGRPWVVFCQSYVVKPVVVKHVQGA